MSPSVVLFGGVVIRCIGHATIFVGGGAASIGGGVVTLSAEGVLTGDGVATSVDGRCC